MKLNDVLQSADWKSEKHVPVIETVDSAKAGEMVTVTVSVGKEIAHPNTTEHHIRWIQLYFKPEGVKAPYEVAQFEFNAHGEAVEGPNQGPVFTEPFGTAHIKLQKSGTFIAVAYCNIHGIWESSKEVRIEG